MTMHEQQQCDGCLNLIDARYLEWSLKGIEATDVALGYHPGAESIKLGVVGKVT